MDVDDTRPVGSSGYQEMIIDLIEDQDPNTTIHNTQLLIESGGTERVATALETIVADGVMSEEYYSMSKGHWQQQAGCFQVFECKFGPSTISKDQQGIVRSFTTGNTFNSTVGESRRLYMDIMDESYKRTNGHENNFFKAIKWSPDGACLLSSTNDNCLRIFPLPDAAAATPEDTQLTSELLIKEGEVVYDMCWYPGMTSLDPSTCCVLSSSRDHPVHLWDAYTGELRCSYTIVDHCEVNVAPNATCFNLDGSKIYCGYNNMIQIFDTARPGRDSVKRPTVPTRKSKEGQKGVISCLAFNPDHSDVYAAGSYLKTIGLYDARAEELIILLRDNHKKKEKPGYFHSSPMGGVTQVRFSPDGQYLYSASRQDPLIRCWDTRNTADVVYCLERPGELTNQRISFDISSDGRWLTTGDMNGDISIFDLRGLDRPMSSTTKIATTTTTTRGKAAEMTSDIILTNAGDEDGYDGVNEENKINDRLVSRLHVHDDVVSAATFHPSGALLATCSGQRKYELLFHSLDSSSDASDVEEGGERELGNQKTEKKGVAAQDSKGSEGPGTPPVKTVSYIDNSIRLWTLPGDYVWYVDGQRWSESTSISAMDATMPVSPSPSYPVSQ